MPMIDIQNNIKLKQILTNKVITTNEISNIIDLKGFGSNLIAASVGKSGDTLSKSIKFELELHHSDDGISFYNSANSDIINYVTGMNTGTFMVIDDPSYEDTIYQTSYIGKKRYIAIMVTATGKHINGTPISLFNILGDYSDLPV